VTTTTDPTGPRRTLTFLRVTVTLSTVCVCAQPVLAGGYLAGTFDFLDYHSINANAIGTLLLVQVLAAVLYRKPGGGSGAPLMLTTVELATVVVQIGMGYSRALAVHIPLGVFVVLLALHVCVWVYRPKARLPRPVRTEGRVDEPVA
jgi:hypothetical protein